MDVIRARRDVTGIHETRLQMGALTLNVIDLGRQGGAAHKWMKSFEDVNNVMFVVNLASYDEVPREPFPSRFMKSVELFESVVNSPWFHKTGIVLLLNNYDLFKHKLLKSPLGNYFPDYSGGSDINKAVDYILWRFNRVNRANLPLYAHFKDITDTESVRFVLGAVKETLLNNALRDSGPNVGGSVKERG